MHVHASLGFRLHTGWATLVAVAADGSPLRVVQRVRLELLPPGPERFVYHQAAELPIAEAPKLIEAVRTAAESAAREAIRNAIQDLQVTSACVPTGSAQVPEDLPAILRSHARIHSAEGDLYADAVASACRHLRIPLITAQEREVWERASVSSGIAVAELKGKIDMVRRELGPPWTADHKIATAAALIRV